MYVVAVKQRIFVSKWQPNMLLSTLFLFRRLNFILVAATFGTNAMLLVSLCATAGAAGGWAALPEIANHLVLTAAALGPLLEHQRLVRAGWCLLVMMIGLNLLGVGAASGRVITTSIGVLGQVTLLSTVRRRGAQRKIVQWCLDDLLETVRPIRDEGVAPSQKLALVTPGPSASATVEWVTPPRAKLLGAALGAARGLAVSLLVAPWRHPAWLLFAAFEAAGVALVVRRRVLASPLSPWERWRILLPDKTGVIDQVEVYWAAFLQEKPQFRLVRPSCAHDVADARACEEAAAAAQHSLVVVLGGPWTDGVERYRILYRPTPGVLAAGASEWDELDEPLLAGPAQYERLLAERGGCCVLSGLPVDTEYEVRVDAAGEGQPLGTTLTAWSSGPAISAEAAGTAAAPVLRVILASPPVEGEKYRVRYQGDGVSSLFTWQYRDGLAKLALGEDHALEIPSLRPGALYRVQVLAQDAAGRESRWLPEPALEVIMLGEGPKPPTVVPVPTFSLASPEPTAVVVAFDSADGDRMFVRYRSGMLWTSRPAGSGRLGLGGAALSCGHGGSIEIGGLLPGTAYEVQAYCRSAAGGSSAWGPVPPAKVETAAAAPEPACRSFSVQAAGTSVALTLDPEPEDPPAGYTARYRSGLVWYPLAVIRPPLRFADDTAICIIGGLQPGTVYEVQVAGPGADGAAGGGAWGPVPPTSVRTAALRTVIARHAFVAEEAYELSFAQGATIEEVEAVVGDASGEWLRGTVGGVRGLFPSAYAS